MLVPEKKEKLCLVNDYRQQIVKSSWPIPSIEIFDTLGGSSYFSTIDKSGGFYQLPMDKESQVYTAFSTHFGSFKWLRMPMGLTGSSNTFHSLMEHVLSGLTRKTCVLYPDDCIVFQRARKSITLVYDRFSNASTSLI